MALARLFEKTQKKPLDIEQMRVFCQDIATIITPTQLIQQAIKITRFSRKGILYNCSIYKINNGFRFLRYR